MITELSSFQYTTNYRGGGGCEVPETSIVNVNTAIFLYKFQYAPNKNKKKEVGRGRCSIKNHICIGLRVFNVIG